MPKHIIPRTGQSAHRAQGKGPAASLRSYGSKEKHEPHHCAPPPLPTGTHTHSHTTLAKIGRASRMLVWLPPKTLSR
jgi:hypothetical protein